MRSQHLIAAFDRFRPTIPVAVCVAALVACPHAFAAADDQMAPASPVAAPSAPAETPAGFVAAARKLVDEAMQKERAVVAVLRESVVSHVMSTSWRFSLNAPYLTRATAIVSRGPLPADLPDDSPQQAADSSDLPLGARWRVVHGDANSHVPAAAWMPDMQNADVHNAALRPTTSLSGEWALPNDFSLGLMPGMAVDYSVQGRRQSTGTFAVTLGKTWSPQWRTFVDMARDRMTTLQLASGSTNLDAGISFIATPSTQIDFAVTRNLSDASTPMQAGLGLSSSF